MVQYGPRMQMTMMMSTMESVVILATVVIDNKNRANQ